MMFLLIAGMYSVIVPLYEAPDEPFHLEYVRHIVTERRLPVQRAEELGESHQPPLYYLLCAVVTAPVGFSGSPEINVGVHYSAETFPYHGDVLAVHLSRLVSVLAGVVTVYFTYALARETFSKQELLALLSAGLVAFNSQFLFISGVVNPDGMVTMWSTIALWQMARLMKDPLPWKKWMLLGLWIGLTVMSKTSSFTVGLMAAGVLLIAVCRQRSWPLLWKGSLAMGSVFAVISGWWFVRNQNLYGDPLGWQTFLEVYSTHLRRLPFTWAELGRFLETQFRSYWAVFGWMTVPAPEWFYKVILSLYILGLAGWGKWAIRQRERTCDAGLALLVVFPLIQQAYQLLGAATVFNQTWYQGRHVFPMLAPVAILMAAGLLHLLPNRRQSTVFVTTTVGLGTLAIGVLFFVIAPAYPMIPLPKWRTWFLPCRYDVTFGEYFHLKGCEVDKSHWKESGELTLSLYWEVIAQPDLDYSVFVHLVDSAGVMVAQYDEAPGVRQGYPARSWYPEDIVISMHPLSIPRDSPAGRYELRIGVYFWADGHRLPAAEKGISIGSFFVPETPFLEIGD